MPNHVYNTLLICGDEKDINEFRGFLLDEQGDVDFNNIIPMPEIMKGVEPNCGIVEAVIKYGKWNVNMRDMGPEDTGMFKKCCEIYHETGYAYWYDWTCAKWGTKWNAYDCEVEGDNLITWNTAWSGVPDLMKTASKEFPNVTLVYEYADEDIGSNVGTFLIKGGDILAKDQPLGGSVQAYKLSLRLMPEYRDCYKLVGGVYVYEDEDEE